MLPLRRSLHPLQGPEPLSPSPRRSSRMRNVLRKRKWKASPPTYNHFASSIRTQDNSDIPPKVRDEGPSWRAISITLIAMGLIACCFALSPNTTLRVALFGQLLLCEFPPFFDNWIVLIPILLPMNVQSRFEVVLGLAMLSWVGTLNWSFAHRSIQNWLSRTRQPHPHPQRHEA